ncbi:RAMP superfamily CRISPR-associated protein [Thermogemmatispora sp.]|uniref:RAMP superfamily CRISPR-associated protein n=1 Tax=Thermogemmatispora sp. TaxID=1968838 RepID=UPI0035E4027A
MNPYDFARIDWNRPPERRKPIWHHRLFGSNLPRLYSGSLELRLTARTPIFIPATSGREDRHKPTPFIQDGTGHYIIPGSSLKGLLRSLVETLGNGCLTLFDGNYERSKPGERSSAKAPYKDRVKPEFLHCGDDLYLCIACRLFGSLKERERGVFMGKVNISDAQADPETVVHYEPMYTLPLVEPKPHHRAFYLDERERYIAGRKFYFHHDPSKGPWKANKYISFTKSEPANRYIHPLNYGTVFYARLAFTNLERDELGALLLAIVLEEGMCHKIGYAKPLGLGSIVLEPLRLELIDYARRYNLADRGRGNRELFEEEALAQFIGEVVGEFQREHVQRLALEDLRRIWRWPPDPTVEYRYPDKSWFDQPENARKRIAETRDSA